MTYPCFALYPSRRALSGRDGREARWMTFSWRYSQQLFHIHGLFMVRVCPTTAKKKRHTEHGARNEGRLTAFSCTIRRYTYMHPCCILPNQRQRHVIYLFSKASTPGSNLAQTKTPPRCMQNSCRYHLKVPRTKRGAYL
jgi:hypothetical protein